MKDKRGDSAELKQCCEHIKKLASAMFVLAIPCYFLHYERKALHMLMVAVCQVVYTIQPRPPCKPC